jgi:hypothetical protein
VGSSRTSRGDRERWRGRGDISLGFSLDVSIFLTVLFQNRRRDAFVAFSKSSGLFDERKDENKQLMVKNCVDPSDAVYN